MRVNRKSFDGVSRFALTILVALIIFSIFANSFIMVSSTLKDLNFPSSGTFGMLFDYSANIGHPAKMMGQAISNAVAYAFINISALAGIITLIIALILGSCVLITFMRSKTLDKVALTEEVSSTVDRSVAAQVQVGDKGYAVTRLALIGNAEINGHVVEVRSADGFLNEKTPVVVTCVTDNEIIVQKIKNT